MTSFPFAASGTESHSVPDAASIPASGSGNAAALQLLTAALATLTQAQAPAQSPAPAVAPPTPAPVTPEAVTEPAMSVPLMPADPVVAPPAPLVAPAPAALETPIFRTTGPWVAGALYIVVPTSTMAAIVEEAPPFGDPTPVWYCITKGRFIGITLSNALALSATVGVSGFAMKGYKMQAIAVGVFNQMLGYRMVAILP
ncbi:hypothetical protein B0H13DRAFT_2352116 [Mycena leptocephala]|nr:hypothetical protein B0H13DRAFT_2352116 [Mycena leptocephala]